MHEDELARVVRAKMRMASESMSDGSQYWLPLAQPTYGPEEVLQAIDSMTSFKTSMWEKTRQFEDVFGETYGAEAVMVNSGSSADLLMTFASLEASGGTLRPGDEVCVPAVTWPTHLWSVLMAGLVPILVDVDPGTLNMSVSDLKRKITERTRAIFPVHLMGNPADMDGILEVAADTNSLVLEDCCEALGATLHSRSVGTLGLAGSFSFFFSHHITTMEGGMILTTDSDFAERLRLLRAHGWSRNVRNPGRLWDFDNTEIQGLDPRYTFVEWGFNVRPTELQAGFGLEQMKRVSSFESHRRDNYETFKTLLTQAGLDDYLSLPVSCEGAQPSWFALPLLTRDACPLERGAITEFLDSSGVETRPLVAGNLARHPVKRRFPEVFVGSFPGADVVHGRGFYLGLYPEDMSAQLERLVELLSSFISRQRRA